MKAKTYTDYYNILLEGCKEAFKSIELKEYLYTDEAMEENKEYFVSKESIKQIGINKSNNLIVNFQIERDMKTDFLRFLERQQQVFEKKYLIPRNEFYEKCLKSLNIKLTELNRQEYRVLKNISDMGTPPDPLLFLEYMKWDIKNKSLQTNKTPEPQQVESVKTDEVKPNIFDFIINVYDKNSFLNDLTMTFNYEKGKSIKAMINILIKNDLINIPDRKFRIFIDLLREHFKQNIGTYASINDSDKKIPFDEIFLNPIINKLKPLIKNHKANKNNL